MVSDHDRYQDKQDDTSLINFLVQLSQEKSLSNHGMGFIETDNLI